MAALSAQWGESESAAGRPEGGSAHEQLHKDEEGEPMFQRLHKVFC